MNRDILYNKVIKDDMQEVFNRVTFVKQLYHTTILITGATGMLASYLTYFLIWLNENKEADIHIIASVRNETKCKKIFGRYAEQPYFETVMDDICAPLEKIKCVDYIVHAASLASPQYYGPNPVEVAAPNVIGTYYLLQLAKIKDIKGFLYFSSGDIYGKMPAGTGSFTESQMGTLDPLNPHSCYGESKRMGETWCESFAREYHIPTRIVRIAHTYSPFMDVEKDPRVFASFMKCLIEKRDIIMLSDGSAKRPFCYITDAVVAFLLILLKGADGNAYNLCNMNGLYSIRELADILVNLSDDKSLKVVKRKRDKNDSYMENKANHDNLPDSTKLMELGWNPSVSVSDGFNRVYHFLLSMGRDR